MRDHCGSDRVEAAPATRRRGRVALRAAGIAVALAALALCARTLAVQWSEVRRAVAGADFGVLVLALALSGLSMAGLGVLWWRSLQLFDERLSLRTVLSWYFAGELGKYLPGSVWPVLGRGELAVRGGVRRAVGYTTTLLGYGVMCVAAAVVCGALAPFLATDVQGVGWAGGLMVLVPVGVVVAHPAVFGRILALGRRATGGRLDLDPPPWGRMLALIGTCLPTWVLAGAASVLVASALGYHPQPARVAFAAVLAWIVGFLAVPVPAGAGVRELVFVGVCGLALGPATAVAAISRLLFIAVDAAGGVSGLLYVRGSGSVAVSRAPVVARPAHPPRLQTRLQPRKHEG